MKTKWPACLIALLLLLVAGRGWAANAPAPTPPPGALVACSACNAAWTITFVYPDEKNKKPSDAPPANTPAYVAERPRTVRTVKTNDIVHETYIAISGSRSDKWYVGPVEYRKKGKDRTWFVDRPEQNAGKGRDFAYTPLPATGFRDLEKISAANYLGSTSYDGHNCLVFNLGTAPIDFGSQDQVNTAKDIAFIDIDSRLPVEVRRNGVAQMYAFTAAPGGTQSLPEDLTAQINQGSREDARLAERPPRPY